jgi:hypothetical protein
MFRKKIPILAAAAALSLAGTAYAGGTYASTSSSNAPVKSTAATKTAMRSPESIQCSKKADQRNLHGKDRKQFRASCKTALRAHKPIPEPHKT